MTLEELKAETRRRAEIMLAWVDGKVIECNNLDHSTTWIARTNQQWDWINCDYRIAEKQPKKIVIQTWIGQVGYVYRLIAGSEVGTSYENNEGWTHIPELDLEVTINE